ncbi:MAG: hypothetical protein EKK62_14140 [Acidimicrobiia bacterium]|nr:MAG: hypothetical protein EKK62_14140 [Acidimicrobiia bacterium]
MAHEVSERVAPYDITCAIHEAFQLTFDPSSQAIDSSGILAPPKVIGCTVPASSSTPACSVSDSPSLVPGVTTWV